MTPILGRPVSEAELHQLTDLQGLFNPGDALKRVDAFAKWVFASTAVVGTLGAGFSGAVFGTLSGAGKLVFGLAVLLVGGSLFAATLAIEPLWVHANLSSRDSMLAAVGENLRKRRRPIQWAAGFFASALVLAAMAPIASVLSPLLRTQHTVLNYEWKADESLSAQFAAAGLKAYCPVEFSVRSLKTQPLELARIRKAADGAGKVDATLNILLGLPPGTVVELVGEWADTSGYNAPLTHKESVQTVVPLARPAPSPTSPAKSDSKAANESPQKLKPSK